MGFEGRAKPIQSPCGRAHHVRSSIPVVNAVPSAAASNACFIAADVGGTHARIGLVRDSGRGESTIAVIAHRKYACADYPGLAAILSDFIASTSACAGIDRVAIACAGVLLDDAVVNANLPWRISLSALRRELGLGEVQLINDFQAAAHAVQCMDPDASLLLTPGIAAAAREPVLVLGPGTGLGAAVRIPHRDGTVVLPTESGHIAFAPGTAREIEILRWMQQRGAHVPIEHLVSGPGLVNLYAAICAIDDVEPILLAPASITDAARRGDAVACEAVLIFCALLGSVIGDLISISGAKAVFIAGGIVPQLKDFLPRSDFRARLLDKGAMRAVLERVPVRLIEDEQLGVIGAASWYLEHLREERDRPAQAATRPERLTPLGHNEQVIATSMQIDTTQPITALREGEQ
ncbi:glucokinase [Lysobacter sp. CFH 32150]|uniref:glucokinase n=1 Tax=Lysobacter sp. CFH 32150 TaxID=2927128 RepID=UPI001FA7FE74|nr:glucokinase [Lysobacter sp. CFH 32150]